MPVGWGCIVPGAGACWQGLKAVELCYNGEPKPVGRGAECESGEDAWLAGTTVLPPLCAFVVR